MAASRIAPPMAAGRAGIGACVLGPINGVRVAVRGNQMVVVILVGLHTPYAILLALLMMTWVQVAAEPTYLTEQC